jgi:hypothetical protein
VASWLVRRRRTVRIPWLITPCADSCNTAEVGSRIPLPDVVAMQTRQVSLEA